jgi:hypothetical protein
MKTMFKVGLVIALLCAAWQVIMIAAGWLTNPKTFAFFYLVVLIQVLILIWGLRQTAAQKSYGGQVLIGTGASIIAGILLFLYSLLVTTVLFPNLIGEMKAMATQSLEAAGQTKEQITAALTLNTPLNQATQGLLGTVITGFLASLVIAIFVRKKR